MKKKFPDGKSSNPAETNEQAYPVARVCRFLFILFFRERARLCFRKQKPPCFAPGKGNPLPVVADLKMNILRTECIF